MKFKPFHLLVFPIMTFCSCSGPNGGSASEEFIRPDEYYADFSGSLNPMNINYSNRRDGKCGVEFYWSKAKIIAPEHYMVISTLDDYNKRLNGLTASGGSVDYISLDGIYFDDGAMDETLRIGMIDYDYRQVFVYYTKPPRIQIEDYSTVVTNLINNIRKYTSDAEIYFFVNSQSEEEALSNFSFEKVYIELKKFCSPFPVILSWVFVQRSMILVR